MAAPAAQVTKVVISNTIAVVTIESDLNISNEVQSISDLAQGNWLTLTNLFVTQSPYVVLDPSITNPPVPSRRYYRVMASDPIFPPPSPSNMVLVTAGNFIRGDTFLEGSTNEIPTNTITVSAFQMDKYEVTKALWDEVYAWAITNGYDFSANAQGKAPTHPAHSMTWHDAVKWCNARSEKGGRVPAYYTNVGQTAVYRSGVVALESAWVKWNTGYRLPTEAEWEKAARGGLNGRRFPWSGTDTISHGEANYNGTGSFVYDLNAGAGHHPTYNDGTFPYTSPVGSFGTNGFGLYDMAGNLWEWCWDRFEIIYYGSAPSVDPKGPDTGPFRVNRGGSWAQNSDSARVAKRRFFDPSTPDLVIGFRTILPGSP